MKALLYKETKINYILKRKKVKNINMRLKPDNIVYISAGNRVSIEIIEAFILSKAEWILEGFNNLQKSGKENPKEYINGTKLNYLGKEIELRIHSGNKNTVKLNETYLDLFTKDATNITKNKVLIEKWFAKESEKICKETSIKIYKYFSVYNIQYPTIKMRKMTSRWGSCRPTLGVITFNKSLVQYDFAWIEYIVLHEFAHLVHPNHSKNFYLLIEKIMPDYKERKKLIK